MCAKEGDRNALLQGRKPVCPPCGGVVVTSITCGGQRAHDQCHDGGMRDWRSKLEVAHGAVTTSVCGGGQGTRDVERQANAPEAWMILQAPEKDTQDPFSCVMCDMPHGV